MSDACRDWRGELAATAAGQPDPDKQPGFGAHLDGCAQCREELRELERVAATLWLADPDRLANPPRPPVTLAQEVSDAVATVRRRKHQSARWRNVLVAGLAAAAVFAVILSIVAVTFDSSSDQTAQHVAFTTAPSGVAASADLIAADGGTQIQLKVDGLGPDGGDGDVYWLWLSTADGSRVAAGTFSGDGTMHMTSALPLDKTARVWVTDKSNAVVLDAPVH